MTQLQAGLMRVPLPRETPDAKLAKQVSAASERYPSLRSASIWLCCSLALRIAPRAQCGVINAAAAALCSRTAFLPFLHVPFSLLSRPLAYRRRLHIKNLYRLLRFVFELLFRRLPLLLFRLFSCLFLLFLCFWHAFDLENVALGA